MGHPLTYPVCTTIGALAVLAAWAPFADPDQLSALAVVALGVVGYSGYRLAVALGTLRFWSTLPGSVSARRVRQEHQLLSRSWLELRDGNQVRWIPVYFMPELLGFTGGTATLGEHRITLHGSASEPTDRTPAAGTDETELSRGAETGLDTGFGVLPAGRERDSEPPGRLVDNPSRVDPNLMARAATVGRLPRRLLLDAQSTVAAPFIGLLWVYVVGGGLSAFTGSTCVSAAVAIWLSAIRGSDPS